MAYEIRPDTGSLFKNDKKTTDAHPNATGSAMIGGVDYWVSAWTKETKDGQKWQSLAFKRKDEKSMSTAKPKPAEEDSDQSIPF